MSFNLSKIIILFEVIISAVDLRILLIFDFKTSPCCHRHPTTEQDERSIAQRQSPQENAEQPSDAMKETYSITSQDYRLNMP